MSGKETILPFFCAISSRATVFIEMSVNPHNSVLTVSPKKRNSNKTGTAILLLIKRKKGKEGIDLDSNYTDCESTEILFSHRSSR